MPRLLVRATACAALACLGSTACATYHPATIAELPVDQRVRVRLAPEELARNLMFVRGPQGHISARFVEASGDSATFLLTGAAAQPIPGQIAGSFSQVTLPLASILELERREAAAGRSMLLSASLVGGVALLAYLGFEGDGGNVPGGDEDGTDQFAPGLRVVIPIGR